VLVVIGIGVGVLAGYLDSGVHHLSRP
jgi:hypothetical protein